MYSHIYLGITHSNIIFWFPSNNSMVFTIASYHFGQTDRYASSVKLHTWCVCGAANCCDLRTVNEFNECVASVSAY